MNCQDIDAHLADYLGDEIGEVERAAFEVHLEACSKCRGEVNGLGGTIGALRALPGVSADDAQRQTADLIVMRRPSLVRRVMFASLRAAAMIGLGVMLGWATFGRGGDSSSLQGGGVAAQLVVERGTIERGLHPAWYKRGRQVASAPSSFARHLAMIAPRHDSHVAPVSSVAPVSNR